MAVSTKKKTFIALAVLIACYLAFSSINFSGIEVSSVKELKSGQGGWAVNGMESADKVILSITDDFNNPCGRIARPELGSNSDGTAILYISSSSGLMGMKSLFKCSFTVSIPQTALEGITEVRVYNEDIEGYTSNLDSGVMLLYKRG